jgi:hypothetical protein
MHSAWATGLLKTLVKTKLAVSTARETPKIISARFINFSFPPDLPRVNDGE